MIHEPKKKRHTASSMARDSWIARSKGKTKEQVAEMMRILGAKGLKARHSKRNKVIPTPI